MAIVCNLKLIRKWFKNKDTGLAKRLAHRKYRRRAKNDMKSGREINEKPTLTSWDLC